MFFYRGPRITGSVCDLIQPGVSFIPTLKLGSATLAHALYIERVSELQKAIL